MSFVGSQVEYRYHPNQQRDEGITSDWIVGRHDLDVSSFPEYDSAVPLMPMRRFMDESNSQFYAASPSITATLPSFGSLDLAPYAHTTSPSWSYSMGPGLPSPPQSGPSSSYFSSCASDRQSTPLSPPESAFMTWSPEMALADHFDFAFGGECHSHDERKHHIGHSWVALHDVQNYEDPQPENLAAFEDDTPYFGSYASAPHEGYQPVKSNGELADSGVETDENDSKDDDYHPQSPNLRRRRPQPARSVKSPRAPSKITKRSGHARRSSALQRTTTFNGTNSSTSATTNRAFPCALANYGCSSTFGSKNEWKRHVNTQHMRLAYWRCDQCDDSKKTNDFNRKDLFIQHVRRMHPIQVVAPASAKKTAKNAGKPAKGSVEDQTLNGLAERCFRQDRSPPDQSGCHFCSFTFEDDAGKGDQGLWDKRLEHVAQHMENAKKVDSNTTDPSTWDIDTRLEGWLVDNEIVVKAAGAGGLVLV